MILGGCQIKTGNLMWASKFMDIGMAWLLSLAYIYRRGRDL